MVTSSAGHELNGIKFRFVPRPRIVAFENSGEYNWLPGLRKVSERAAGNFPFLGEKDMAK